VANGVVYVGSFDSKVYALNASTGAKLWSFTTGNAVYSSPAVANGVVYVGSEDNKVYALNASTGAKLWSFVTGSRVASSPAVANGVVYVGSENGNVYAFDQTGGALVRPTADRPNPSTLRPNLNLRVSEPGATALGTGSND
jgi:outer membrane protein assembly factor BamB